MKRRDNDPWLGDVKEGNRVARAVGWRASTWIIVILLFFAVIGGATWAFKVLTSEAKGAGDAIRITNDAQNRINAQEWFPAQLGLIKAADRNLTAAQAAVKAQPNDQFAQTELRGLEMRCNEMVQRYNADAQKVTRAKWRDPSLPMTIDDSDPATDCKSTVK